MYEEWAKEKMREDVAEFVDTGKVVLTSFCSNAAFMFFVLIMEYSFAFREYVKTTGVDIKITALNIIVVCLLLFIGLLCYMVMKKHSIEREVKIGAVFGVATVYVANALDIGIIQSIQSGSIVQCLKMIILFCVSTFLRIFAHAFCFAWDMVKDRFSK